MPRLGTRGKHQIYPWASYGEGIVRWSGSQELPLWKSDDGDHDITRTRKGPLQKGLSTFYAFSF